MNQFFYKNYIIKITIQFVLIFVLMLGIQKSALASIHTYPDGVDQVMYRSQQSFRDSLNRAWQLVLYKHINQGTIEKIWLRLVGFPGIVELTHSTPLTIITGTGQSWQAPDVWNPSLLPINVGEYDVLEMMNQFDFNTPVRFEVPLKKQPSVELVIPPFAVQEWQELIEKT